MPVALRAMLGAAGYAPPSGGGGGPDGTQYYVEVTIASSEVASTLTDFPVYVDLSDLPAAFFTNVQSDGGDIRVTESDGTTRCPTELVAIDAGASTGELHFLASSISSSSDTTFRIYYDGSSTLSQPGVATTYGRNAVWSDYAGVWHDGGYLNSADGDTATEGGGVTSGGATGQMGDATTFDGTNDYLRPASLSGDHDVLSAWVNNLYIDNNGSTLEIAWATVGAATPILSGGEVSSVMTDETLSLLGVSGNSKATYIRAVETGWTHFAFVWNGTDYDIYVNGSAPTNYAGSNGDMFLVSNQQWEFGARTNNGNYSAFTQDEARVRSSTPSTPADWIAAEYTNQNTPTTFYTIGSQTAA